MDKLRNKTVDQIKGLGILLVVLGHIASPMTQFIFTFHMPLFFALGGMFINRNESMNSFLGKNIRRIVVPYLICGVASIVIAGFKNLILHRSPIDVEASFIGLIYWMNIKHLIGYGFVLWFLPALFWSRFFVYCFLRYEGLLAALLLIVACCWSYNIDDEIPFGLKIGIMAIPWTLFGYYLRKTWSLLSKNIPLLLFILLGLEFALVIQCGLPEINVAYGNISAPFYSILYTLIAIVIIFTFFKLLNRLKSREISNILKCFSVLGIESLLIYLIHPYFNNLSDLMVNYFFNIKDL